MALPFWRPRAEPTLTDAERPRAVALATDEAWSERALDAAARRWVLGRGHAAGAPVTSRDCGGTPSVTLPCDDGPPPPTLWDAAPLPWVRRPRASVWCGAPGRPRAILDAASDRGLEWPLAAWRYPSPTCGRAAL